MRVCARARACVLTAVGKLEGEHAALVEVQLVLVRLGDVQDLHVAALHAHRQPLSGGTVAQREDLQTGPRRDRGEEEEEEEEEEEGELKKETIAMRLHKRARV